jgi:hypothetical protein
VPAAALAGEGTVVMAAPVVPPAASTAGEGTVLMAAAPPAPQMEGTLVMESPVRVPSAPSSDADGTVVIPSPVAAAADGTVVMQAPPAPVADSTVLMSAPPAPRSPAPMAPPVGGAGAAMEGTVVMAAPAMVPPPPPEGRAALAPFADEPATGAPPPAPRAGAPRISGPIPMPPKPTATAAMPPIEPPRKKSAAPLAIAGGGAGLLLLAALVGGVVWFVKSRRVDVQPVETPAPPSITQAVVTPTPPPPAVVVNGKLHVESVPAGATVTLNGEARGVTPLDVTDLLLGNHDIKVELRGFAPVTQTIVLSELEPNSVLQLTLEKAAPVMGVAEVISTPSGALVKIDGTGVGQTPLMNHSLKAGKHQVEVVKEGYEPWAESITVGRRKARVDAQLRAVAKPTPVPVVADVPDPNKTYEQADVDTPPRQVTSSSASYPKDAPKLRSGQSVSVGGTFVVTTSGDVVEIQIRESGGASVDGAVMAALAKRKYTPGVKKGVKVKVRVPFRQTFQAS